VSRSSSSQHLATATRPRLGRDEVRLTPGSFGIYAVGVSLVTWCGLTSNTESAGDEVTLLFVQDAHGASLNENFLTLVSASEHNCGFPDRPERLVRQVATADFVSLRDKSNDVFKDDSQNTNCRVTGETLSRVVELRSSDLGGTTFP